MTITDAMVEKAQDVLQHLGFDIKCKEVRAALEAAYPQANVDLSFLGSEEADRAANEIIIADLQRENEALRNDLSLSNNAWEKSQGRIAELERENEALRKRLADVGALLAVVGQNHDHN